MANSGGLKTPPTPQLWHENPLFLAVKLQCAFYYDDWYPHIWDFLIKSWIYSAYVYNQDKCMNLYLYPQVQVKCTNRCDLDTKTYKY